MTSQNPIVLDDETMGRPSLNSNHASDPSTLSNQSSKMTSQNLIVLDDEDMERPPYTGIQQWAAMRRAAASGLATTTPNRAVSLPQTSSALEPSSSSSSSSSQTLRRRTASAYMHLPVTNAQPKTSGLALWHLPLQQVCKGGAKPTPVCGRYSPALRDPPKKPRSKDTGAYRCPRCNYGYARIQSLRRHFPSCVALNGNPDCDAWTDHDSYPAGARSAGPIHLVMLGIAEVVVRKAAHYEWDFFGLEPPAGVQPPSVKTKEEEDDAWKEVAKNVKEDTRNAVEISAKTQALIQSFKEEGQWDSDFADEA